MRRLLVGFSLVLLLTSCASGDTASPEAVPGTEAWVNDRRVGLLHEGQYVGQLEMARGGGACRGNSGSESTGSTKVTLRIDDRCRVYVESIEH